MKMIKAKKNRVDAASQKSQLTTQNHDAPSTAFTRFCSQLKIISHPLHSPDCSQLKTMMSRPLHSPDFLTTQHYYTPIKYSPDM